MSKSRVYSLFDRKTTYSVELTTYHTPHEVTGGKERCSELPLEECQIVCRIKHIQNHCNCFPTLWPDLLKHVNDVGFYFFIDFAFHYLSIETEIL